MTGIQSLAFLGTGQMAEAIMRGVIAAGLVTPEQIIGSDVRADRLQQLTRDIGIRTTTDNREAARGGQVILLSVKPQDVKLVLSGAGDAISTDQVVVSIAAGVTVATLESALGPGVPVIRVMPNTPCLVGAGMAAIARGTHATADHEAMALSLFNAAGRAVSLPESAIDAVTGLSGSGPAFIAMVIEALADGGVRAGLPRDVAMMLATQTTYGTALMIRETGHHPGVVKDMVSSPGGTTIAGVHALEKGGLRAALMDAVVDATNRSKELGRGA
jgi:pyrroline-5-carboxylate reductase